MRLLRPTGGCVAMAILSMAVIAFAADNTEPASPSTTSTAPSATTAAEPPTDWIDPATGHRIIRLSQEPGTSSLYFHQNAYNHRGDKLFVTITTRPAPRATNGVAGPANPS